MNTNEFTISKERSASRGWLYVITHPDWEGREPAFAVATSPEAEALRGAVEEVVNAHTSREIVEGMAYDFGDGPCRVWLSSENQANYAAYLKAVELGAESITIKVESLADFSTVYATIPAADYPAFYLAVVSHIKSAIEAGWRVKDSIDYQALKEMIYGSN